MNQNNVEGKKTLVSCIYSGQGVTLDDDQTNIVTNWDSSADQDHHKLYFPIEKILKDDLAKDCPNIFILGVLNCGRARPGQKKDKKDRKGKPMPPVTNNNLDESNQSKKKKNDLESEKGFGNYVITFSVKLGKTRKAKNANKLIPWYYYLFKYDFGLRTEDYTFLPIPRYIFKRPPIYNALISESKLHF